MITASTSLAQPLPSTLVVLSRRNSLSAPVVLVLDRYTANPITAEPLDVSVISILSSSETTGPLPFVENWSALSLRALSPDAI